MLAIDYDNKTVETALEVHKVLNDNLEVVDDVECIDNEGVEAHGSVEDLVKINQASTARDMATFQFCTGMVSPQMRALGARTCMVFTPSL